MNSPLDDFDYRSINIDGVPRPTPAHCYRDLALVRFESVAEDCLPQRSSLLVDRVKKNLKASELWSLFVTSPRGYQVPPCLPSWRNIDDAAEGAKLYAQHFPNLATMNNSEFNNSQQLREFYINISERTNGFPLYIVIEMIVERITGKTIDGKPIVPQRYPYEGT